MLAGLLHRIGNFGEMRSFEDRLIFQKTVYLLQSAGFFLGYPFSYYLYGPYSPQLTRDGYDLASLFGEVEPYRFTNGDAEKRFRDFLDFLGEHKGDAVWLEAAASIHSLRRLYPELGREEILTRVEQKQPYFDAEQVLSVWSDLEDFGLLARPAKGKGN